MIDVVKDQLYGADYIKEEDPKFYHSEKSGRGPLNDNWLEEYWREVSNLEKEKTKRKFEIFAFYIL